MKRRTFLSSLLGVVASLFGVSTINGVQTSVLIVNGRPMLTNGVPVTTADVTGATTVYFTQRAEGWVRVDWEHRS